MSSGARANQTGNRLERFVIQTLQDKGYQEFWDHKEQVFNNLKTVGGKQFARQVMVGLTIYETKRKCDFLVLNPDLFPHGLIIECKWQQSGGSVDEKYPFLLFNILKTGVPTIVLLDGQGYKPTAKDWLKQKAQANRALLGVWSMAEFHTQINNGFLG